MFTKKIVQHPKMHNKETNASLKNLQWHFCVTVFYCWHLFSFYRQLWNRKTVIWATNYLFAIMWCATFYSYNYIFTVFYMKSYGLDSSGFKHLRGRDFLHPSRLAPRPIWPLIWWAPDSFLEVKQPGHCVDHHSV